MVIGAAASVIVMLGLGGAYWVMNDKPTDDVAKVTPSTDTAIIQPSFEPLQPTAAVTPPPASSNEPSALDILNEKLKSQPEFVKEPKKPGPSAEQKLKAEAARRASEERARKAAAERARAASKPQKQPDWGNQRQGSF